MGFVFYQFDNKCHIGTKTWFIANRLADVWYRSSRYVTVYDLGGQMTNINFRAIH